MSLTSPQLAEVLAALGDDEQRVMLALGKRLLAGQQAYGKLDLARDKRDWRKEAAEEAADLLAYLAFDLVAADARRREP